MIHFTRHPEVQKAIIADLEELLEAAKLGELKGLFVVTLDREERVQTVFTAENRYTLMGAGYAGLAERAAKWGRDHSGEGAG